MDISRYLTFFLPLIFQARPISYHEPTVIFNHPDGLSDFYVMIAKSHEGKNEEISGKIVYP